MREVVRERPGQLATREVRVRQIGVERQCLLDRDVGPLLPPPVGVVVKELLRVGVRERRVAGGELRVSGRGAFQQRDGGVGRRATLPMGFVQAAQVEVVGGGVGCRPPAQLGLLGGEEGDLQLVRHRPGHLPLDGARVLEALVVGVRPEVLLRTRIDELEVDAQALTLAPHGPFEQGANAEVARDVGRTHRWCGVALHRAAGEHP